MTNIPIDALLLGVTVLTFVTAIPVLVGIVGVLLWGTRPNGRRARTR